MSKTYKWLGGGLAAALLLGLAGLFGGAQADAQEGPPLPPAIFSGEVSIDGEAAPAGSIVTAWANGEACGTGGTVRSSGGVSSYTLEVPEDCGNGATISFAVGGNVADESAEWNNTSAQIVNLTISTAPVCPGMDDGMMMDDGDDMMGGEPSEPMEPEEPMEPGMDDMDDDMMMDDDDSMMMDDSMDCPDEEAPDLGDTGTGLAAGTSAPLAAMLGVMAMAIALGGFSYARRNR